jgi:hypothetical protein
MDIVHTLKQYLTSFIGFTGLALDAYQPVSGNWCWLSANDPILRYALGHAWRLTIILIVICLFTYLFIYMHRHFSSLRSIEELNSLEFDTERFEERASKNEEGSLDGIYIYNEFEISEEPNDIDWNSAVTSKERNDHFPSHPKGLLQAQNDQAAPPPSPLRVIKQTFNPHGSDEEPSSTTSSYRRHESVSLLTRDPLALVRRPPVMKLTTTISPKTPSRRTLKAREAHIQKLLLFNAYPVAYIILWIPGILNRFVELTGHTSRTLEILQASTQFVGLANACK